jgi:hypothetical protein
MIGMRLVAEPTMEVVVSIEDAAARKRFYRPHPARRDGV